MRRIRQLSLLLFSVDLFAVFVGLAASGFLRRTLPFGRGISTASTRLPWFVYLLGASSWMISLVYAEAYDPQKVLRWYREAARVIWGSVLGTAVLAGILYFSFRELSRLQFVYFLSVTVMLLLSYRALLRIYYRSIGRSRPRGRERVLIIGAGTLGQRVANALLSHSRWGFHVVGYLDDDAQLQGQQIEGLKVLGPIRSIRQQVEGTAIDEIWVALPPEAHKKLDRIVLSLSELPVRIKVVPDYYSLALVEAKPEILAGLPVIGLRDPVIEGFPRIVKRVFDIVFGTLILLPALPLMAGTAIAILLSSEGPVLIRQQRVGENGRLFDMLKFRSMFQGADQETEELARKSLEEIKHKKRDDPRVTKVGRFLRRFSLDELPQLFNVLKGDMSLVGPRPELPWLVDRYDPWQRKRFAVPQGITGWWQIQGRSDKPMHLNTDDDLYYVYNYSLWLDIQILFRTPIVVLRGKGAF